MDLINNQQLKSFLQEDIASGDITTDRLIPEAKKVKASIIAEDSGIVCGIPIIRKLYALVSKSVVIKPFCRDGQRVRKGAHIAVLAGNARAILKGERTALNLLQQLSGTATLTSKYVDKVRGTKASIYDTRKTIPGMRILQKYAVKCGGGKNHRFTLNDAVLVKDNHLSQAGSFEALKKATALWRKKKKLVEIEADNMPQVRMILNLGVDIIMLDNFSLRNLRKAVAYIKARRKKGKPAIEVSGGISLNNIRRVASLGVERIAVGAITHSSSILNYTMEYTP